MSTDEKPDELQQILITTPHKRIAAARINPRERAGNSDTQTLDYFFRLRLDPKPQSGHRNFTVNICTFVLAKQVN